MGCLVTGGIRWVRHFQRVIKWKSLEKIEKFEKKPENYEKNKKILRKKGKFWEKNPENFGKHSE